MDTIDAGVRLAGLEWELKLLPKQLDEKTRIDEGSLGQGFLYPS